MRDEPIACTRLSCTAVMQCADCRTCADDCECGRFADDGEPDPTPLEVESGDAASERYQQAAREKIGR